MDLPLLCLIGLMHFGLLCVVIWQVRNQSAAMTSIIEFQSQLLTRLSPAPPMASAPTAVPMAPKVSPPPVILSSSVQVLKPQTEPSLTEKDDDYTKAWNAMVPTAAKANVVQRDAQRILDHKTTYSAVSAQASVPWFVIGILDMMESGGGCVAHLHNGDPLNGRTIHVPAGRPPAPAEPPFTWEASAIDALAYEGLGKISPWNVSGVCYALEKYNGFGYHNKGVPSPYLWSFSNQYTAGKFVKDHEYDPSAVSQQAGGMVILKELMALDPSIKI